jgi:hypothetical protein
MSLASEKLPGSPDDGLIDHPPPIIGDCALPTRQRLIVGSNDDCRRRQLIG